MVKPGLGSENGIAWYADVLRDLICRLKTDAMNVFGQGVRIGADRVDGRFAVGLINPHCAASADAVRMQKDHDLADELLLRPGFLDALAAAWADTVHFLEAG